MAQALAQTPASLQEAQQLVRTVQDAARTTQYGGTFVYQQGSQMRSSRLTHWSDGSTEREKLEILDGRPREYLRTNDEVECYFPDTQTIQREKNITQEAFPALFTGDAPEIGRFYTLRKQADARVAGIECQTYWLEPRDTARYGYRLCIDKRTHLLLRAQTLGSKNEVIEQIAFTQLHVGEVDPAQIKTSYTQTARWKLEKTTANANIESGWRVRNLPAGFRKIQELNRTLPPLGKKPQASPRQVTQLLFSDGLATVSLFIEQDTEKRNEGSLQQGAMSIISRRLGEYWMTGVGEVPPAALQQIVQSAELQSR